MSGHPGPGGHENVTVGIDFASSPAKTAVVAVRWTEAGGRVEHATAGLDDAAVMAWLRSGTAKVGIDCPFGWPRRFVQLVGGHADASHAFEPEPAEGWRRDYYLRVTDRYVADTWGITPLSVAADRIAHPALRLSFLFSQLHGLDLHPRLDGSGRLAEVYPAAALKQWGLTRTGYKKRLDLRRAIVDELATRVPLTFVDGLRDAVVQSDDVLDALVCALIARAVEGGLTQWPRPDQQDDALVEGWIHVPDRDSLGQLGTSALT